MKKDIYEKKKKKKLKSSSRMFLVEMLEWELENALRIENQMLELFVTNHSSCSNDYIMNIICSRNNQHLLCDKIYTTFDFFKQKLDFSYIVKSFLFLIYYYYYLFLYVWKRI